MRGPIQTIDPGLEEAAWVCGADRLAVARKIVFPLLRQSLGSTFLLAFALSMEQFAIPAMIGIPGRVSVLSTELYNLITFRPPKQGFAAALGLLLAAMTCGALWLNYRLARLSSATVVTGKSYRPRIHHLTLGRMPAAMFCFTPALAGTVVPFLALLYAALAKYPTSNPFRTVYTLRSFTSVAASPMTRSILWNTLVVCGSATFLTAAAGLVISYQAERKRRFSAAILRTLGALSFGIPGVVIGLGFLLSYVRLPIYGTLAALILAFSARYLPYATETSTAALRQIDVSLEEAAEVAGAGEVRKLGRILLPLLRPTLQSASILLFLSFLREISAAAVLYTPGTQVLSVAIWTSFENADWGRASALSLIIVVVVTGVSSLAARRSD